MEKNILGGVQHNEKIGSRYDTAAPIKESHRSRVTISTLVDEQVIVVSVGEDDIIANQTRTHFDKIPEDVVGNIESQLPD
jgi:hypothetical protein